MSIPDYETLMLPVLKLTTEGHERVPAMLPLLKTMFSLSDEDMQQPLPSGRTTVIARRTHWARTYLVKAGLQKRAGRGICHVTDRGKAALASKPEKISNRDLDAFPDFLEWRTRSIGQKASTPEGDPEIANGSESGKLSPHEMVERSIGEIESELSDDILSRTQEVSPERFEQLIVDLLLAMGYGRGMPDAGRAIGRSGDGGIDGVIDEDALGLDAVYVQAKRYAPGNKVGRPAIQQFVGSLTGENASKGVFVTTSDFSAEARAYAQRVQQRIILIDGQRLARLMITHEVGVRARQTYVLRSVDEDYFIED